jgi:hypothetical protein
MAKLRVGFSLFSVVQMSLRAADLAFWRPSNLAIVAGIALGKKALAMTKMKVISEIEQVYHETVFPPAIIRSIHPVIARRAEPDEAISLL